MSTDKPRSADRRVPITEDAFQLALQVRAQVQKKIRMRPDISVVVSAMLAHVAASPELVDAVAQYGLQLSAKAAAAQDAPA